MTQHHHIRILLFTIVFYLFGGGGEAYTLHWRGEVVVQMNEIQSPVTYDVHVPLQGRTQQYQKYAILMVLGLAKRYAIKIV